MANVYNTIYRGEFCNKSGETIYIDFKKRMLDIAQIPTVQRIIFAGEDSQPVTIVYGPDEEYKLTPINTSECTVNIKAVNGFELTSLYTTDEREWQVVISGAWNWIGYLIPDSSSEPFESQPYDVSVKATDTLKVLKDVPFNQDNSSNYRGEYSDREVLRLALHKTGLDIGMVIGINMFEDSMSTSICPLSQAYINGQRFIDTDQLPFSCEEVIRSILVRYSARLFQFNGQWQIVSAWELSNGTVKCYVFDANGNQTNIIPNIVNSITAGGQNRPLRPVGNKSLSKAYKNATAYYQYGYISNSLINGDMDVWSSAPNGLPDGWEMFGSTTVVSSTETRMFNGQPTSDHYIAVYDSAQGGILHRDFAQVRANDVVRVSLDWYAPSYVSVPTGQGLYVSVFVQSEDGYYFTNTGWTTTYGFYVTRYKSSEGSSQNTINFDVTPRQSDYKIRIGMLPAGLANGLHFTTNFNNAAISSGTDAAIKPALGTYNRQLQYTSQTYTPDPIVLLHADDSNQQRTSRILIGDDRSVSNSWIAPFLNSNTLLHHVANIALRMHSRPYQIFEAQFIGYGLIDVNTLLSIDLTGGLFIFLSGEFDLKKGVHSLRFAEVITAEPSYQETQREDYGTVKDSDGISVGQPSGVNTPIGGPNTSSNIDLAGYHNTQWDEAYSWGNHAGRYPLYNGTGAFGTWAINITGNAATATRAVNADFADLATRAYNADYALDSDKWDGFQFADYLNQPVRVSDDVRHRSLGSPTYVSGFTGNGFKIEADGSATFDNLTVRKAFNVYELIVNKISGTNGALAVTDTVKVLGVFPGTGGFYNLTIDTDGGNIQVPFQINDLIRCQQWNGRSVKYYFGRVTGTDVSGIIGLQITDGGGIPATGDVVARFGSTTNTNRQGLLYLTSSDTNSPYLDVLDGINSASLTGKTKVRLGRLDGIVDPTFGALSGYGLYGQNVYLTGAINVTGGNAQTITGSQNQANAALSSALNYATGQSYKAGRMLYTDPEFFTSLNGLVAYNNTGDGSVLLNRISLSDAPNSSGFALELRPSNTASPGFGGVTFFLQTRANAIFKVRFYVKGSPGQNIEFNSNSFGIGGVFTWNTPNSLTGGWQEVIGTIQCGSTGSFSSTAFFYISGNTNYIYFASGTVYDMTSTVDSLAYADGKVSGIVSTYQLNLLKNLAYQTVYDIAIGSSTLIQGGYINTVLLNAVQIQAQIINVGYIEGLSANFYQGTIGGIVIANNSLYSSNGNFSVTSAGDITAKSGTIGGLYIGTNSLYTFPTGRRIEIVGGQNSITFYDTNNYSLTSIKDNVDTFIDDDGSNTQRNLAGMTFNKYYSSNPSNPDLVRITGNGIYSNTGFAMAAISNNPGDGTNAYGSVIGYTRRSISLPTGSVQAGIVGLGNTGNSYGGFFKHMQGLTALRVDGKVQTTDIGGVVRTGMEGFIQVTGRINGGTTGTVTLTYVNGFITGIAGGA